MESSQSVQLSNVISDDYKYFESNHIYYPVDAATVFGCVAELRVALQAFREAATHSKQQADTGIERIDSMLSAYPAAELLSSPVVGLQLNEPIPDDASSALLASGSVETDNAATSL
jgi:hypothetical protein